MPKLKTKWKDIEEAKYPMPWDNAKDESKTISSIETEYNGYKFRSRLEARWAVFFDAAGIEYEYEQEGYELPSGERYLPDFYLPKLDMHAEVKGKRIDDKYDYRKSLLNTRNFIQWGGPIRKILILTDIPGLTPDKGLWHFPIYYYSELFMPGHTEYGWFFFWQTYEGGVSGNISAAYYDRPRINEWDLKGDKFSIDAVSDVVLRGEYLENNHVSNKRVFDALLKARQARFEFGETPKAN